MANPLDRDLRKADDALGVLPNASVDTLRLARRRGDRAGQHVFSPVVNEVGPNVADS